MQKQWYLQHWIHYNKKIDDYENIYSAIPLYLIIGETEKNGSKYLVFDATDENKEVLKKTDRDFVMGLKMRFRH